MKSRSDRGRRRRRRRKPGWGRVLLALALPAAALVWFFWLPDADRAAWLDRLPEGSAGRAVNALISFAALAAAAWILLPVVHYSELGLRRAGAWHRDLATSRRILLSPLEFLVRAGHLLFALLFAGTALLVVCLFVLTLLFVVWIFFPDFLGGAGALGSLVEDLATRLE